MQRIPAGGALLIILSAFILMAFIYGYHEKVQLAPQSVHHWRQSDCASITYNYYSQDLALWESHTMGLVSDSGTQALNLTSEIPLYYWGIAQLYKIFGPHESLLRGINTTIFLSGLVALTYSLWLASGSLLWALLGGAMLFTSPVLVYYGNNYLSNAPAFGMALMALACFTRFYQTEKRKYWWWSVLFFLFAGSLKLPGLFLFFAVAGSALLFPNQFKMLNRKTIITSTIIVLTPIITWLVYARMVNQAHDTVYFSTTIFPLWELSSEDIAYIFAEIKKLWLKDYGHWTFFVFFLALLAAVFLPLRSSSNPWKTITLVLIPGLVLFSILQFYTFMQHDYYLINMYILLALILVAFSLRANNKVLRSPLLLIAMSFLLAFNINYASNRHQFRYEGFHNAFRLEHSVLYDEVDEWLSKQGVAKNDSLIFISDDSHTSLYLMRRYGWTTHKMAFKDTALNMYFNRTAEGIEQSIENGASHLIVANWHELYSARSYLLPYTIHLVAQKEQLMLFDLRDTNKNFQLPPRELYREILLEPDSQSFPKSELMVAELSSAITGTKVVELGSEDVYSLSADLSDIEHGMIIEYSVWIKAEANKKIIPVISSIESGLLFKEDAETTQETGDWRRLKLEYVVDEKVENQGIRCFIWNPEGGNASLDDIKIRIFYPLDSNQP